ncbi:histidine kinase-like protein [Streptomyces sp. SLBN-118]|uniref:ATP-binding protein n=1 Tax=Streptomyces sp. SLBN-118 TaxID=2768454 RepID=UPI0011541918|nr:ATP-binding protein [Streptomyces sp. SLBN-118]TQK42738.1 histidine kinase-like protein [Streptomyces sp. SLBN-118]
MLTTVSNPYAARRGTHTHRVPAARPDPRNAVRVYAFTVRAVPAEVSVARKRAARVLWDWGLHEDGLHTASLVISELVGNAARHAAPHSVRTTVALTRTGTMLALAVHDDHPFLPLPRLQADPGQDCGRGLLIVESLAREAGGALQVRPMAERGKEIQAVFPAADSADSADLAACLAAACPVMHFQRQRIS